MCNKFYRPVGGPESIMFDTARELERLGHTPIPFAMSHPENVETFYSRYFVPMVDYNEPGKGLWKLVKESISIIYSREAQRRIEQLIDDSRPDIAHLHNIYHQLSPSILVALKRAGVPTVLTLHDYKLLCANMLFLTKDTVCEKCAGRWFHHAVFNKCVKCSYPSSIVCCIEETLHRWLRIYERNVDLFIAPSYFLKRKMVEYGRLKESCLEVLPNYADTRRVSPQFEPGNFGLFIGRLDKHKGVLTILEACKQISEFEIRFAGRGELMEECTRIIERDNLSKVKLLGFQQGKALMSLLQECRFVLVPSEWYENCPMVVLLGFAAGKPVIASKIGGIPELVSDGVDGFLFEPGNAEELASCMSRFISAPDLAEEMGRSARRKVEELYSIEAYMQLLIRIYDRVLVKKTENKESYIAGTQI